MDWIAHSFEIRLSKEFRHGWSRDSRGLWYEQRMVALLVTAAVITVMLHIVMQEGSLSTDWAGRVIRMSFLGWRFRRPLMPTLLTLVLLMSV